MEWGSLEGRKIDPVWVNDSCLIIQTGSDLGYWVQKETEKQDMVNQNLTEVVAILDRSGSMANAISDTIGGFNTLIKEQKEVPGECRATLVIFDDQIDTLYEDLDVNLVQDLNDKIFFARNMTKLADALGTTINRVGARLAARPEHERPGKIIVFVSTDGLENASREFTTEKVRQMIETQKNEFNWQFIFSGADIDAYQQGGQFGFSVGSTVNYAKTFEGTRALYGNVSAKMKQYRTNQVACCDFSADEKGLIEQHVDDQDVGQSFTVSTAAVQPEDVKQNLKKARKQALKDITKNTK